MSSTLNTRRKTHSGRIALGLSIVAALTVGAAGWSGDVTSAQAPHPARAGGDPFVNVDEASVDQARATADHTTPGPVTARSLLLDRAAMAAVLAAAPDEGAGTLTIELPAPDGTPMAFDVWKTPILAPELAARYPEITTYAGQGITDGAATVAFDLTPDGFHAQVLAPSGNWYIDPALHHADRYHQSFYRDQYTQNPAGEVVEEDLAPFDDELPGERAEAPVVARSGAGLRTYRLAVAANSTYTAANGGTRASAMAAIVTTINRVSGIYEKELAIRLQLVAGNDALVYESSSGSSAGPTVGVTSIVGLGGNRSEVTVTTAAPHGLVAGDIVVLAGTPSFDGKWAIRPVNDTRFTIRNLVGAIADESGGTAARWSPNGKDCDPFNNATRDGVVNQAVVDGIIGHAGYDIGHVFNTSGGRGAVPATDANGNEAVGATGIPNPTGDRFAVDNVAHDLGHQFGAAHTMTGTRGECPGNAPLAESLRIEPGSGSTIMAFAGICGLDDLQRPGHGQAGDGTNASDPYFNSASFDQIVFKLNTVPMLEPPPAVVPNGNTAPSLNAGPDIVVPAQTPFFLGATGTDENVADVLTFNFEQRNAGPDAPLDDPPDFDGPRFRSFPPTTNPTSFFPRLLDLAVGNTNQHGPCPALNGIDRGPADCWSQFLIPIAGPNSIPVGNSRQLDFRATVRDNRAGGGGVNSDNTAVTVRNTGTPFAVIAPNGGLPVTPAPDSQLLDVAWNPAGTTAAPINAAKVSIRLSTDGGLTFPTELVHNTPNDGAQSVSRPNVDTDTARIMVHSGSYVGGGGFFDISDADFSLDAFSAPATTPSAPINPLAAPGNGQVKVSWTPPASDGGAAITGYKATASPGGQFCTAPAPTTTCSVTGLTNGTSYTVSVIAINAQGNGPAGTTAPTVPVAPSFTAVKPFRLEDTRPIGTVGDRYGTGSPMVFNVLGHGGLPASGVDAVSLNVTVVNGRQPTVGGGYATVWGCGTRPNASNLNFVTGQTIANEVITPVSSTGNVCVFVYGFADILVDINGYFPTGSDFTALTPRRLKDTRGTGKVGAKDGTGAPLEVQVTGTPGVPGTIDAVSLNVTAANGENPDLGGGYVTVWGCETTRPNASNINFTGGQTIPNAVITPVSPTGKICVYVYGRADILVDINGYFPTGSDFTALTPRRLKDTRGTGKVGAKDGTGAPLEVQVTGTPGVPGTIDAVSLNVTAANGENPDLGGGYVTVWGCETTRPNASNINFTGGQTIPNAVITPVSPTGKICVYVYGRADILVDINGYFPT